MEQRRYITMTTWNCESCSKMMHPSFVAFIQNGYRSIHLISCVVISLLCFSLHAPFSHAAENPQLSDPQLSDQSSDKSSAKNLRSISYDAEHDLFTVKVQGENFVRVMKEVGEKTGMQISVSGTEYETITKHIDKMPLYDGLKRLLRGTNHVIFSSHDTSLWEVRVLPKSINDEVQDAMLLMRQEEDEARSLLDSANAMFMGNEQINAITETIKSADEGALSTEELLKAMTSSLDNESMERLSESLLSNQPNLKKRRK